MPVVDGGVASSRRRLYLCRGRGVSICVAAAASLSVSRPRRRHDLSPQNIHVAAIPKELFSGIALAAL